MPFAVASAGVRAGYALSPFRPIGVGGRDRSESASGGPVSLPLVLPSFPFYGLNLDAPGAKAGYRRPVGADQDQNFGVGAIQGVAGRQARFLR
jgi:hypothetical protein